MTQKIDYFFGIGSPWAYVGFDAFVALVKAQGAEIEPFVIPLIEENGGIYSRNRPPARKAYWLTDLKRWAKLRGLPLAFEGRDRLADPTPAADMIVAAHLLGQDWLTLAGELHRAFWGRGEDVGLPEVRKAIADAAGLDGAALEDYAKSDAVAARKRESYEIAKEAGVFGIPSYRHEGELFWGQDSLPFLERHLKGEKLTD
ncbi:2-hydroxychromene-2-carboxylate isomerase [Paenirhodobacter populi]|uniref:2-hydroxychromene-2-carboxylate isomerase n=1 Tax=Paenirhodobacter populi TaxID=2306993 RepID=A0A443IVV6_9RHOB|nr:DsbA family protein [Sinirhodobacter populi]RWR12225.1 2-hydroxychromene-2-carboxylate isomerase [Sinirhodobacter populi]